MLRFKAATFFVCLSAVVASVPLSAQDATPAPQQAVVQPATPAGLTADQVIDKAIQRERDLIMSMTKYHPVVETYYQTTRPDKDLGEVPAGDRYFLGRLDLSDSSSEKFYTLVTGDAKQQRFGWLKPVSDLTTLQIMPVGFSEMIFVDRSGLDKQRYQFKYLRREFLGTIRCFVFDVTPRDGNDHGRFIGRMWIEDAGYNVVRFNGVYSNPQKNGYYFHMDSWRSNVRPGMWLPTYIYVQDDVKYGFGKEAQFHAQTRLWGYEPQTAVKQDELTDVSIESVDPMKDQAPQEEMSPVLAKRAWIQQAEDNVLDRMERAGLLSPQGELDKILQTVVDNLQITNNLDVQPPVRCRVLMTAPLESFTVGHTIVISRGMVDVLPDEASLAMVLAHELAHIVKGDEINTKYAFADRMGFSDEGSFKYLRFARTPEEEQAADARALELLKSSPYKDKLGSAGLFLRQLQTIAPGIRNLTKPQLGNSLADNGAVIRMVGLMNTAPELQVAKIDQIAALPLGGRVKIDAWGDHLQLVKPKAVNLLSSKEKMPFEITPMGPFLTRFEDGTGKAIATADGK